METGFNYPRAPDKRHHITLVDSQHTDKLSQITRSMWEPVSELQSEIEMVMAFLQDTSVSPPMGANAMTQNRMKAQFMQRWLDKLFINSNSVEGWKNNSMVKALTHATELQEVGPAAKVSVQNGKAEGVKRGLWD